MFGAGIAINLHPSGFESADRSLEHDRDIVRHRAGGIVKPCGYPQFTCALASRRKPFGVVRNNVKHQFEIVDGAGEWTDDIHICIESAIGDVIDVSALRYNSE